MDDWQLRVYIQEVVNQAELVDMAERELRSSVTTPSQETVSRAFMSAQSILGASGMLSKLLWPNPASMDHHGQPLTGEAEQERIRTLDRGKALRKILVKKGDNELLERNRTVRNAFEHFDERLDTFVEEESHRSRNIFDRNIGPPGFILVDGAEPRHLRRIDPTNWTVSVLDSSVDLLSLIAVIRAIRGRAEAWLQNHRRIV
jgi:hypothetical protein